MSNENEFKPMNVLLSREELLLVLDLLKTKAIWGLDNDPLGVLDEAQRQWAVIWASRALRARQLAQLNEAGELMVHDALLTAVGTCAYADKAISITHWQAGEEIPSRYFGHIRGKDIVAHTRPEDVLYLFTLLLSKEELLAQIFDFCEYKDVPTAAFEMSVANKHFAQARELADNGKEEQAVKLLVDNGAERETAVAFVYTLTNSTRVSILQTLKQGESDTLQKNNFTIIQNDVYIWLIVSVQETGGDALLIKFVTKSDIENTLFDWVHFSLGVT